jgi:predicted transcriptional regulator
MTTAKDLMHKPLSIEENSSISQVISKLLDLNKSRLVVTNDHKSVGIVTEKDVAFSCLQKNPTKALTEYRFHK